jgi:hypothetical protein
MAKRKASLLPSIHPGEILREEYMKPLRLSINELSRELLVPVTRVSEIVNERRAITADTALPGTSGHRRSTGSICKPLSRSRWRNVRLVRKSTAFAPGRLRREVQPSI